MSRRQTVGTAIRLPALLADTLRVAAAVEGKTVSAVLREAAEAWLAARGRWPPMAGPG